MANDPHPKPSFSPYRKWSIGLNVAIIILIVFSVVGMLNYLSRDYFYRFHWSTLGRVQLSPLTTKFVRSLTNNVKVILYYDRDESLYPTVSALLNEYRLVNPRLQLETVDYLRDPATAQKIKEHYKLATITDRNLIIFDCEGRIQIIGGDALAKYVTEQVPSEKEPEFRRKPTEFLGETAFTAALLRVTNPKPLNAYILIGHGEHPIDSTDANYGYLKFAGLLEQNGMQTQTLSLLATNVPADCHLLIIAGPRAELAPDELEKIEQYLAQGGRLLALFNAYAIDKNTGLESILAKWGVEVGREIIADPDNSQFKVDIVVSSFSSHQIVNPLINAPLDMIRPRAISKINSPSQAADAPRVEELAWTGPNAMTARAPAGERRKFPLMAAVEKPAPRGVSSGRGACRMVVVGDSLFLANKQIEAVFNRDFARYAINWLVNRTELLEEIGPRKMPTYQLVMTRAQLARMQWLLLAVLPGIVLLVGTAVWFRRRR